MIWSMIHGIPTFTTTSQCTQQMQTRLCTSLHLGNCGIKIKSLALYDFQPWSWDSQHPALSHQYQLFLIKHLCLMHPLRKQPSHCQSQELPQMLSNQFCCDLQQLICKDLSNPNLLQPHCQSNSQTDHNLTLQLWKPRHKQPNETGQSRADSTDRSAVTKLYCAHIYIYTYI